MRTMGGGRMGRQPNRGGRFLPKGVLESAGPAGSLRGTASQLMEKYVGLGKDLMARREYTRAEDAFQHAEHYRRLFAETRGSGRPDKRASSETAQGSDNVNEGREAVTAQQDSFDADVAMEGEEGQTKDAMASADGDLPSFLMADDVGSVSHAVESEEVEDKQERTPRRQVVRKTATAESAAGGADTPKPRVVRSRRRTAPKKEMTE